VIDPISAYLGGADSHVDSKSRGVLAPLTSLAQTLRFALIGILHLNKSNSKQAIYRSNGSIAFIAAARSAWCFAKNPDDEGQNMMLPLKINLAPHQTGLSYSLRHEQPAAVRVVWGGPVSRSADSVLSPEDSKERSERIEATDWLRDRLSGGPVTAKALQAESREAGFSWRTVRRAKEDIGAASTKDTFDSGWTWVLDPQGGQKCEGGQVKQLATLGDLATLGAPPVVETLGYTLEDDGLGAACNACLGRFRTVAGWRAHVARGRCYQLAGGVQ
jgi:putative DNA primase/helicase